jgi:hypothetical protein
VKIAEKAKPLSIILAGNLTTFMRSKMNGRSITERYGSITERYVAHS